MARLNVSLQELQSALEKAGGVKPKDSTYDAAVQKLGVQGQFEHPYISEKRNEYMAKIKQMMEMDGKLARTYGDPSSKLYIEDPMAREQATYAPRSVMESNVDTTGQMAQADEQANNQRMDSVAEITNTILTEGIKEKERLAKKAAAAVPTNIDQYIPGRSVATNGKRPTLDMFVIDDAVEEKPKSRIPLLNFTL